MKQNPEKIIFYDGECLLCEGSVLWIQKRNESLFFALLSGETAKRLELVNDLIPSSIIYWNQGKIYSKSSAVLQISRELKIPWNLLYIGILCPAFLRDTIYSFVAKHRYRWFGKRDTCSISSSLFVHRTLP